MAFATLQKISFGGWIEVSPGGQGCRDADQADSSNVGLWHLADIYIDACANYHIANLSEELRVSHRARHCVVPNPSGSADMEQLVTATAYKKLREAAQDSSWDEPLAGYEDSVWARAVVGLVLAGIAICAGFVVS